MPGYARKHQLKNSLIYHVYNRSHRGDYIFEDRKDLEHFMSYLSRIKEKFEVKIYHWVIMSNHFHLCLEIEEPEKISKLLAGLQRAYTHYYNRTRRIMGYLWQGRFKSQAIEKQRYLMACGRYIERNPVRAKIIKEAHDYAYSSAGFYVYGKADRITERNPFYEELGSDEEEKRLSYRQYLKSFDREEEGVFRSGVCSVGSAAFKAKLVKTNGHFIPKRRGKPRKELVCK